MALNNPYAQYQQNAINAANSGELTLMLYNGALKFAKMAIVAMEEKKIEQTNHAIQRLQEIITELMVTLNMDYEISHNLSALYDYMKRRTIEANVQKDQGIMQEVQGLLKDLRDAWAGALKQLKNNPSGVK